jgi:16S rRNA (cytosine967-C5)-methyltransferase
MKLAGRVQAAIDILDEVLSRHRATSEALKDWGKAHRFAGSGDRHAIGTLVYDGLRQRLSAGVQGGGDAARNIVLGVLRGGWDLPVDDIAALTKEQYGPAALTEDEEKALHATPVALASHVAGNYPDWLSPVFKKLFGDKAALEGVALAQRAPVDLRVNTLKTDRAAVQAALAGFAAVPGPYVQTSLRIAAPLPTGKHVNVEVEPAHGMGWFEVQDTASQIAAALTGVKPGETVADICAGAGGKTLALAALMQNKGRLVAHDIDKHRLRPIFERITRSGASCIEVLAAEQGAGMQARYFDCVVVDAPCSGSGTWRRKPDAKWRLTRKTLDARLVDQRNVLARGAALVRRGGRLCYFTCSLLPEENTAQVHAFLAANLDFKLVPYTEQWAAAIGGFAPASADGSKETLLLTPYQHDVDGFFVAVMKREG